MRSRHRLSVAVAAGLVAAATSASAEAATVSVPTDCVRVVPGLSNFPVVADGFAPAANLTFTADGNPLGLGQADAAGHFDNASAPFPPPQLPAGRDLKTFQLTADDGAGTVAGPIAVKVVNVAVRAPANAAPTKRVRFRVFGFLSNQPVYLHIRRSGRTKGRFSLGRTAGPCGTVSKRMRFMPLRHYTTGTYGYYFSHSKTFRKSQVVYEARVRIYRTFTRLPDQATAAGSWG